jgi:2-C-methyl-D-erythritol 4-phosphate cytidylyltransferase
MVRLAALLVAGGRGTRFGAAEPKQFLRLGGRPLYEHAARTLHDCGLVDGLFVVAPPGYEERMRAELGDAGLDRRLAAVVAGGASRQESVWRGLEAIGAFTHVLVHDAARPFVSEPLVIATLGAAIVHGAASVGLPVSDTLFRAESHAADAAEAPRPDERRAPPGLRPTKEAAWATAPVSRDGVWTVQTPQVFELELLREAHRHARHRGLEATDDAGLVVELGRRVELVRGHWWNIKVTRPSDLERAELLLALRDGLLASEEPA